VMKNVFWTNTRVLSFLPLRKHLYSASAFKQNLPQSPIIPKLNHIVQYFILFPTLYSKLGHKLKNVEMASINKVLITFIYTLNARLQKITPRKYLFCKRLCKICLPNCSETQLYCYVLSNDIQ
jgi:hypothetical protein